MQYSSGGPSGKGTNYIYSIWNTKTIAAYHHPKVVPGTFGNEGNGVKMMTFSFPWSVDYWNVLADRFWDVGNRSYTGFFVKDEKSGVWSHLITWNIPIARVRYSSNADEFLEDWVGNGYYRQIHCRRGWKRRNDNHEWFAITKRRYSYNTGDASGRSVNKRNNWEAGIATDSSGPYYFMGAGGSIPNTGNANTTLSIPRTAKTPQENYGVGRIVKLITTISGTDLFVSWIIDSMAVPQFASKVIISDESSTVLTVTDTVPQRRADTIDISNLSPDTKKYTVTLSFIDIFDGQANPLSAPLGGSSGITHGTKIIGSRSPFLLSGSNLLLSEVAKPKIDILNVSGRTVATLSPSKSNSTINLRQLGLACGVYVAHVMSGNLFVRAVRFTAQ